MRQVVLDTETTGIDPKAGHRIIEIGCVELFDRKLTGKHYHQYINPEREIEAEAIGIHGITNEFVADKPVFGDVADQFLQFIDGAELIIHNAPFDVGFINHEFNLLNTGLKPVQDYCGVIDTLVMARQRHPGQRNNLDALCKRYYVDNSKRDLHGALLDSEILADVYLAMTGGQTDLKLEEEESKNDSNKNDTKVSRIPAEWITPVLHATDQEQEAHQQKLKQINTSSNGACIWLAERD